MSRYIDADLLMQKWLFRGKSQAMYRDEIRSVPTADVAPVVHADWIKDWEIGCSDCSHCGKGYLWEDYKGVADWKYCPNCGAKIDNRREIERRKQ